MNQHVKYELHLLEKLLGATNAVLEPDLFGSVPQEALRKEIDRIKNTFVQEVFSFEDERHLERYIQYHQQALIRLMDGLVLHDNIQNLLSEQFYNAFDELLTFIERHFARYFDQDAKAPKTYLLIARREAKTHLQELHNALSDRKADPLLIDLVLYALTRVINNGNPITYRKIIYAKQVQRELYKLLDRSDEGDINGSLRQLTCYLNYNSIKAFVYYTRYWDSVISKEDLASGKLEKLSFALKTINQVQVKPGVRFNHEAPSLKDQLSTYLYEEIEYYQKVRTLNAPTHEIKGEPYLENTKLKLDASVAQVACILKILTDNEIIQNRNLTDTMRLVAKVAVTKRSESISYDSLRAKYYNIEQGTWNAIRLMLIKMSNYVDNNHQ